MEVGKELGFLDCDPSSGQIIRFRALRSEDRITRFGDMFICMRPDLFLKRVLISLLG